MTAARTRSSGTSPRGRAALAAAALVAGTGLVLAPASASTAEEPASLRPAHLVPELGAMDIRLSPFSGEGGAEAPQEQPLVETTADYGSVGSYSDLPAGSYAVSARPAGTPVSEPPLLSLTFSLEAGEAYTVVGMGTVEDPRLELWEDDLTPPGDGQANVRLVVAANAAPEVDIQAVSGPVLGEDVPLGTVTDYSAAPAGPWTVQASSDEADGSTDLVLDSGTVYTLLVLDAEAAESDDLRVVPVVDAVGMDTTPAGGADTGAAVTGGTQPLWLVSGTLLLALGAGALVVAARTRVSPASALDRG